MDSIDYNEFTTSSDAFIELEDFDCFIELESSFVVYADRLSRSKYTLGTTDNFENNSLLENEILTVHAPTLYLYFKEIATCFYRVLQEI